MEIVAINDDMITKFVEESREFKDSVQQCFTKLDIDGDNNLSQKEFRQGLNKILPMETTKESEVKIDDLFGVLFDRFDEDKNGNIDADEFGRLMKEILLALARGIGNSCVMFALDERSLLAKAVRHDD